jgi:uncharacterized membrane protein
MSQAQSAETGYARDRWGSMIWVITGVVIVVLLGSSLLPSGLSILLTTLAQLAFTVAHGTRHYGARAVAVYYAATLIISNALENLSIVTGFPFGHYHYTDLLGPKVFLVPLVIGPAYAATGYLAWIVGTVLLGEVRRGAGLLVTVGTPVVASFAMVAWDLSLDPGSATIKGRWIWEDGGGFFGVPLGNFLGWSLTVYLFFQVFALYLRFWGRVWISGSNVNPTGLGIGLAAQPPRGRLVQAVLLYAVTAAKYLLPLTAYFAGVHRSVTDGAGHVWQTADIYETSALTTVYGMGFIAILAFLKIAQQSASVDQAG